MIVFKYPLDPSTDYIKRVVGLPGDTVEVRRQELFVNGKPMPRERVPRDCHYSEPGPHRPPSEEHDCELWIETLGSRQHETMLEPPQPAVTSPASRPAGARLRHGRQPRQLVRLAGLGRRSTLNLIKGGR